MKSENIFSVSFGKTKSIKVKIYLMTCVISLKHIENPVEFCYEV